jgi:acyl dehydratase
MDRQAPYVGYEFEFEFQFSQSDVERFAQVTGDKNPLHLDGNYASHTVFKRPIMHGLLSGSIFSKVFGTIYPGEGTIYLEQKLIFKRPMYVDTDYIAKFKVTECNSEKSTLWIDSKIINTEGQVCLDGHALLKNSIVFSQSR